LDIDFTFVKQSAVIQGPLLSRSNSNGSSSESLAQSPLEFAAMPNNVKVAANSTAILNIVAKLKNSYQLASLSSSGSATSGRAEKYNHLLIAKVKDTQIMFSFIIEASVLESQGKEGNMS